VYSRKGQKYHDTYDTRNIDVLNLKNRYTCLTDNEHNGNRNINTVVTDTQFKKTVQEVVPEFKDYRSFKLNYIVGDIFDNSDSQSSLVHCVGSDFLMRKGFAVQIRERYGHVSYLKSLGKKPGQVATLPTNGTQYIFYLVTKETSYDKPLINDLQDSLIELRDLCLGLGIKCLSMPKIASGRDHIPWRKVQWIIRSVFAGTDIKIDVYTLPQNIDNNHRERHTHLFHGIKLNLLKLKMKLLLRLLAP
jgi:hypothetical protein